MTQKWKCIKCGKSVDNIKKHKCGIDTLATENILQQFGNLKGSQLYRQVAGAVKLAFLRGYQFPDDHKRSQKVKDKK